MRIHNLLRRYHRCHRYPHHRPHRPHTVIIASLALTGADWARVAAVQALDE